MMGSVIVDIHRYRGYEGAHYFKEVTTLSLDTNEMNHFLFMNPTGWWNNYVFEDNCRIRDTISGIPFKAGYIPQSFVQSCLLNATRKYDKIYSKGTFITHTNFPNELI